MNRTKKCCVYRDCNTNSVSNPDLTLFQFPKNEERAAKWCDLGAVDPFETRTRFMCELHFPRIYMCFSARRKMLLSMAVPRAFGTNEEDEQEQDMQLVQSSSCEMEEGTMEEHLDECITEENDELTTEIIYLNPQTLEPLEQDEPTTSGKRSHPVEASYTPTKLIKVEKLPTTSRSMVVSSSSTKPADESSKKPVALTPPHGTVLRRVKLKKRPTVGTKTILVKTVNPKPIVQEVAVAAEVAVSSSPEKKASPPDPAPKEVEDELVASPVKTTSAVASSSNSTAVEPSITVRTEKEPPAESKSPQQKDETVYEFIFKGEEYIQMPKAKYYGERKELEMQLEQAAKVQEQLEKKIQYYRRSMKDLREIVINVCEDNDDDDD